MKSSLYKLKIFLITAFALILPVVLCCSMLHFRNQNDLKAYTSGNIQLTLETNASIIQGKLDSLDDASTLLQISLAQRPYIMDYDEVSSINLYRASSAPFKVHTSLVTDTYSIDGFNKYYLYFPRKNLLLVSGMSMFEDVASNRMDCHAIPVGRWDVSTPYTNVVSNPMTGQFSNEKNMSRNYHLVDTKGDNIILTTNVKEQYINRLITAGLQIQPSYAVILDAHGVPLSSNDQNEIGHSLPHYLDMWSVINSENTNDRFTEVTIDNQNYLLNWHYSAENDWYYVTATASSAVLQGSSTIYGLLFVLVPILLVISFLLTMYYSRTLRRSTLRLTRALDSLARMEMDPDLGTPPCKELKNVYAAFEEMTATLQKHFLEAEQQSNARKNDTIRMLQTEINPHMLYNSLESVYSIARINKQDEIASLVMALSRFYRIALSGGKRTVSLAEAFELASQFITVQNIRVGNKILFEHDIPEEMRDLVVPKFLLQPLVENAILHGFKNKRDQWRISITATRGEDYAEIVVRDNGIGISEADVARINERMNVFDFQETGKNKGYALRNLNYQTKLEFGQRSGIHLTSTYGEGTSAIVRLYFDKDN